MQHLLQIFLLRIDFFIQYQKRCIFSPFLHPQSTLILLPPAHDCLLRFLFPAPFMAESLPGSIAYPSYFSPYSVTSYFRFFHLKKSHVRINARVTSNIFILISLHTCLIVMKKFAENVLFRLLTLYLPPQASHKWLSTHVRNARSKRKKVPVGILQPILFCFVLYDFISVLFFHPLPWPLPF